MEDVSTHSLNVDSLPTFYWYSLIIEVSDRVKWCILVVFIDSEEWKKKTGARPTFNSRLKRPREVVSKFYFFDKNLIFHSKTTQLLQLTSFGTESTCPPVSLLLQLVGQIPEKPQSQGCRTPCKYPQFLTKAWRGCKLVCVKTKWTLFFKSVGCCASFGMITTPIAHWWELH